MAGQQRMHNLFNPSMHQYPSGFSKTYSPESLVPRFYDFGILGLTIFTIFFAKGALEDLLL
jgi:hypothetical protein